MTLLDIVTSSIPCCDKSASRAGTAIGSVLVNKNTLPYAPCGLPKSSNARAHLMGLARRLVGMLLS